MINWNETDVHAENLWMSLKLIYILQSDKQNLMKLDIKEIKIYKLCLKFLVFTKWVSECSTYITLYNLERPILEKYFPCIYNFGNKWHNCRLKFPISTNF